MRRRYELTFTCLIEADDFDEAGEIGKILADEFEDAARENTMAVCGQDPSSDPQEMKCTDVRDMGEVPGQPDQRVPE